MCVFAIALAHNFAEIAASWEEWWTYDGISGEYFYSLFLNGFSFVTDNINCADMSVFLVVFHMFVSPFCQ